MPSAKITKRTIDAVQLDPTKDFYLWDSEVPGFGLKVTPKGAQTYLFQYRRGPRTRRVTIGRHGQPWTPEQARKAADSLYRRVSAGDDPAQDKSERRQAKTVGQALGIFLSEHADQRRKSRTADEYRRLVDKHIVPAIGSMALIDVSHPDIAQLHYSLRKTPYQANRVSAVLGSFFTWATRNGFFEGENPARLIEKHRELNRQRFLSPAELATVGQALSFAELDYPVAVNALRLIAVTGMRKSEVLTLQWAYIDRERGVINLPDSKTGPKTVPLSAPALEILATMEARRGAETEKPAKDGDSPETIKSRYVFPGEKRGGHLVGIQKIWERMRISATVTHWRRSADAAVLIDGLEAGLGREPSLIEIRTEATRTGTELVGGLDDVRIHDFRHSFASVGASRGDSLVILGSILGHANASTTQRYAHLYDDPRKAAMESISSHISASLKGVGGQVVPFKNASNG